ncbi:MAG: ATP/GTP-binding protein [Bacteriovoracia bacterium]
MSFVNYNSKEINCKIVYFGPSMSGKTTNLQYIYSQTHPDGKGKMISLQTDNERTLFFDFLPLALGTLRGFRIRFHLYTVPGQSYYDASRRLILRGVDGIVLVSDSQVTRMEANLESFATLRENLEEQGYELESIPLVHQFNKRDLPNVCPLPEMEKVLNPSGHPAFEAVASDGVGVLETLKGLSKLILKDLKGQP